MSRARLLAEAIVAAAVLPAAVVAALAARRRRPARPAVLFGATPIVNTKYWCRALRTQGVEASNYAYDVSRIYGRDDFDHLETDFWPRLSRFALGRMLRRYRAFFWGLRRFDVFVLDFRGGFLRGRLLSRLELPLLRLAGKAIVAIPFGADVIDIRRCPDEATREALRRDYPGVDEQAEDVARQVRHVDRWASFVVTGGHLVDYLPRCDLVLPSALAIDTEAWKASRDPPAAGPIRVVHASNHRALKGTDDVIAASDRLRRDGVEVELVLLEGVPNEEVRRALEDAHVVAAGFVIGTYELFAVEAMSMSRPVLNYWRPDLLRRYSEESFAGECPIVDTSVEQLEANIRLLAEDPELRARLGEEGRRYVERRHSYEAVGAVLADVIERVWPPGRRGR